MRFQTALVLFTLLPGGAKSTFAQVTTTGMIHVILEDQQGGRLSGVTVSASASDVVTTRTAVSDGDGVAMLEALAPSANYTVRGRLSGFRDLTRENVLVRSGQVTTLHEQLVISSVTEQVTVTAAAPVVDVTRAIAGQDITLQLTESLPTGRTYQSYLQLVPGVLPDSPNQSGNPSSRSGMNWKDIITGDNIGVSADNFYYFEGINVTDPVTGTFGANLNTEIIQEQKVITGGIPAEYVGAAGLISTVITKSGSNDYRGSANYFFQNDSLVAENEHNPGNTFSSNDTAFTIGGPAIRNKVWGFGSFRYTNRKDDVSSQDTHVFLRTVETTQKQGFAKGTWTPTQNDLLSFMFLNDPFERSGSIDPSVVNNRDRVRKQGGNNYSGTYNRVWAGLLVDGAVNVHNAEITELAPVRTARNTVAFQRSDIRTLLDEQLGGHGLDSPETRPTRQARASVQYRWREHRFKAGLEFAQHEDHQNLQYLGSPDRAQYTSISSRYVASGVTGSSISTGPWTTRQFRSTALTDFNGFIAAINSLPNRATFYNLYDLNRDGTITQAELGQALVFNSTADNPDGQVNYYRALMSQEGPRDIKTRGWSLFGQDEFQLDRWTFNVGVRAERLAHYATTGLNIFTFPWTIAPRLSAAYDLLGDGRQKVSAYYGRYYDPIRMDMTQFAGFLTGAVIDEQVFANGQWVTYRVRGGPAQQDGFFSNTVKTPHTDEVQIQHEIDLGKNMSASSAFYWRQTKDIFEDFDPGLYAVPAGYPGPVNDPNSLFLGWNYFGFDSNNPPRANFILGTLKGAERTYRGLEFVFRKRFADRWQTLTSYNWLDAKGNAVSDGNADFPGDVIWLDPRAPNMYGTVPGTIHHIVKTAGSYTTVWGLEVGATYRWNSGTIVNKTQLFASRRLPVEVTTPFVYAGVTDFWVAPDAIGAVQNPSWASFDIRLKYIRSLNRYATEFFVDIFNPFDDQAAIRTEDLVAGTGTTKFGDEIQWLTPRRAFFGARVRF